MIKIDGGIRYNRPLLYSAFYNNGIEQRICLEKSFFKKNMVDQYFFKMYMVLNGELVCQGYIYFYLDFVKKETKFIGIYVNPEFRSLGIASLLVASWIHICLNNEFYHFTTNLKQRKPFVIYLLKKFSFELQNAQEYQTSPNTIHICKKMGSNKKYLLFENKIQKKTFLESSIFAGDNYIVLSKQERNIPIIDDVLLSTTYFISDVDRAYSKASSYYSLTR